MQKHGGQLRNAAHHYNIPLENWIDLSTGINPNGWTVPEIPPECWQRLPENDDNLLNAARQYYQCDNVLAVAGSQAAIQLLPLLYPCAKVGVLSPAYAEHQACWQQAGHQIIQLTPEIIDQHIKQLNVLIIVNPNNPTGHLFSKQQLLDWHKELQTNNGLLIVDEAFIDAQAEYSLSSLTPCRGLIILRSIGKFFGLAGIRCGFVMAEAKLLKTLEEKFGEWAISHPSRYIATKVLIDTDWQQQTLAKLPQQAQRLQTILNAHTLQVSGGHALFQWVKTANAERIHQQLAQHGILTRLFKQPESLRFGLPKNENEWQQLKQALAII